jgi:hypothetical protein
LVGCGEATPTAKSVADDFCEAFDEALKAPSDEAELAAVNAFGRLEADMAAHDLDPEEVALAMLQECPAAGIATESVGEPPPPVVATKKVGD